MFNKPDNQINENIDYPIEEEEINNQVNSNTDRNFNQSIEAQGNPAPIVVENVNQNPLNESNTNSDKPSDIYDDVEFQKIKYGN
jgi:hypothetical protein